MSGKVDKRLNGVWRDDDGPQAVIDATANARALDLAQNAVVQDPTGFTAPEDVIITGNSANRTVTLTGTVNAYWQGVLSTIVISGWTSPAHANDTAKVYFLYSTDGTEPTWSETPWGFPAMQIAYGFYEVDQASWVYVRECHGLMDWLDHEESHNNIGAWRKSGGDIGGYVLDSTTVADRRPTVSEMVHRDEDLPTTNVLLNDGSYTHVELTSTGLGEFDVGEVDIVNLLVDNPYYNSFSAPNWGQTLMPDNSVMSVWVISAPMCAGTACQNIRFSFEQGQWITQSGSPNAGALAIALAQELGRSYGEMNAGNLEVFTPELLPIARITITYTGGNWYLSSVSALTGSSFQQSQGSSGNFLSSVAVDGVTITGDGTASNPLVAVSSGGVDIQTVWAFNA